MAEIRAMNKSIFVKWLLVLPLRVMDSNGVFMPLDWLESLISALYSLFRKLCGEDLELVQ